MVITIYHLIEGTLVRRHILVVRTLTCVEKGLPDGMTLSLSLRVDCGRGGQVLVLTGPKED